MSLSKIEVWALTPCSLWHPSRTFNFLDFDRFSPICCRGIVSFQKWLFNFLDRIFNYFFCAHSWNILSLNDISVHRYVVSSCFQHTFLILSLVHFKEVWVSTFINLLRWFWFRWSSLLHTVAILGYFQAPNRALPLKFDLHPFKVFRLHFCQLQKRCLFIQKQILVHPKIFRWHFLQSLRLKAQVFVLIFVEDSAQHNQNKINFTPNCLLE